MSDDHGTGGASFAVLRPEGATSQAQRDELARFLRMMRDRATPEMLGLSVSPRRRALGLLREEVAREAGISTTWITWLEQARPIRPSVDAIDGLAHALRLDPIEREHLFRLARLHDPAPGAGDLEKAASVATAIVTGLTPHPAYAFDRVWNVAAQNVAASALLGAFEPGDAVKGNLLARIFLDPAWRRLFADWPEVAKAAAAQFRAATADIASAPQTLAVIDFLKAESPAFAAVWGKERLQRPPDWEKTLDHPAVGRVRFRYSVLRPEGAARDLRLSIYSPADERTRKAMDVLSA